MTNTDQGKFVEGIRSAIKDVLAEREEASRLDKVEDLLSTAESTINELTDTITKKEEALVVASSDNDSLRAQVEELKLKAEELETKLSDADKKSEELEGRATAAEKELANIEAGRRLESRMTELEEAKVSKSGEKREAQTVRVRDLSDEEFAAYKQELVDIRSDVEAELKAVAAEAKKASEKTAVEGEGVVAVPPADLDKALREEAAAAAAATLDIEVVSETMASTYLEMAAAMASNITAGRE